MDLVGIMEDQQLMIFRILAGILHIGNIDIHPSGEEESEIDVRHIHLFFISGKMLYSGHLHVGMTKDCDYNITVSKTSGLGVSLILFWGKIGLGFNNLHGIHQ